MSLEFITESTKKGCEQCNGQGFVKVKRESQDCWVVCDCVEENKYKHLRDSVASHFDYPDVPQNQPEPHIRNMIDNTIDEYDMSYFFNFVPDEINESALRTFYKMILYAISAPYGHKCLIDEPLLKSLKGYVGVNDYDSSKKKLLRYKYSDKYQIIDLEDKFLKRKAEEGYRSARDMCFDFADSKQHFLFITVGVPNPLRKGRKKTIDPHFEHRYPWVASRIADERMKKKLPFWFFVFNNPYEELKRMKYLPHGKTNQVRIYETKQPTWEEVEV